MFYDVTGYDDDFKFILKCLKIEWLWEILLPDIMWDCAVFDIQVFFSLVKEIWSFEYLKKIKINRFYWLIKMILKLFCVKHILKLHKRNQIRMWIWYRIQKWIGTRIRKLIRVLMRNIFWIKHQSHTESAFEFETESGSRS